MSNTSLNFTLHLTRIYLVLHKFQVYKHFPDKHHGNIIETVNIVLEMQLLVGMINVFNHNNC